MTITPVDPQVVDAPRTLVERYLKSLSGAGSPDGAVDDGLKALLGGPSLVSRIYSIENWKIFAREKHRMEVGELASAQGQLAALDKERRGAQRDVVASPAPKATDDVALGAVSAPDSAWAYEIAKTRAKTLQESNPLFAFLACVDHFEEGYVADPFRRLLSRAGSSGRYTLDIDQFWVESSVGHHEAALTQRWPLFVGRLRSARLDSGLWILPTTESTGASAVEVCR